MFLARTMPPSGVARRLKTLKPVFLCVSFTPHCRFLATWGGRVDIAKETGLAVYKRPPGAVGWSKLTPGLSFMETLLNSGVTGSPQVSKGGKLMMITSISYFIIQVSASCSRQCC
ncbi:unnamed protein product [Ectocarpus sp. 12 AP-2014]